MVSSTIIKNFLRSLFLSYFSLLYLLYISQLFINICFCLGGGLWVKEATDKYCANSNSFADVSNQIQCQGKCEAISTCEGISYGHKAGYTHYCYVCNDDVLSNHRYDFGFYRKPGMFKLNFHRDVHILLYASPNDLHCVNVCSNKIIMMSRNYHFSAGP